MDYKKQLFACGKHKIKCIAGAYSTLEIGPDIGRSSRRPVTATRAPKFSAAALFVDMLVMGNLVAVGADDCVYGQLALKGMNYGFIVQNGIINYEGPQIPYPYDTIPVTLYYMTKISHETPADRECYQSLLAMKSEFASSKVVQVQNLLNFCDDLYYGTDGIAHTSTSNCNFEILENAVVSETVEAGMRSGYFQRLPFIDTGDLKVSTEKHEEVVDKINMDDIRDGKYIVPWNWNDEQLSKVPSLSLLDDYIPNGVFQSIIRKVAARTDKVLARIDRGASGVDAIKKDYINLFITGKPGTGKTTLAYALGAATGMPVYTIPMTKNTEEDVFQGMTKIVNGKMAFVSTDFLYAYEHGGIIVLEEINLPDPSVIMGSLGQSIEFPFVLMKDGYEPVRRHPMCVIIGTMNVGTYGSKGVNQALSSRFRQTYLLDDPSKEDFVSILLKQGCSKADAVYVYNAYDKIINYLKLPKINAEDVCMNVTMRSCIGALENIEEGESRQDAIKNTIIGKIAEEDMALAEDVLKNVVQVLPD